MKEAIFLDEYFVLSIIWKPEALAPLDRVEIANDQESQSEGFEVICHILEQAGVQEEFELEEQEEGPGMKNGHRRGPKRAEVSLVNRRNHMQKITVAVVEYLPPKGAFRYHTIKGRQWIEATKRLESTVQTYNSDQWWISQVVKYISPGSSTSSFHNANDLKGWDRVGEFIKQMQPSELNVVRHWKYHHDGADEYPAVCRHQRHMGGAPGHYRNPYQPATVFFRVSGDEVGQKAFLALAEKIVKEQPEPPTLEEFLEDCEKKSTAEDVSDSAEASSAVSDSAGAAVGRPEASGDVDGSADRGASGADADTDPLSAHDSELDPVADLEEDTALCFGAVPFIAGMGGVPISAIERSLRLHLDPSSGKRRKRVLH